MTSGFVAPRARGWMVARRLLSVAVAVTVMCASTVLVAMWSRGAATAQESPAQHDPGQGDPGQGDPGTTTAPGASPLSPAPLVARIADIDLPPELRLGELTVAGIDPQAVAFRVRFAEPFEVPKRDYRVSVLVGDPNAGHMRASYEPGRDAGVVLRREGDKWVDEASTAVALPEQGTFDIAMPTTGVTPGSALWVEVQSGTGNKAKVNTSPYFSYDSIVGKAVDGSLRSGGWGWIRSAEGERIPGAVQMPGGDTRGALLSIVSQGMSLSFLDPMPESLLDTAVSGEIDRIEIVPAGVPSDGAASPVAPSYIEVDRTSGTIKLFDGSQDPAADVSDAGGWLANGFGSAAPGAPATLTFNLAAIAKVLGMTFDPDSVALGVDRQIVLADGRSVIAPGVLGTMAWFDLAPQPEPAPTTSGPTDQRQRETVVSSEDSSSGAGTIALVAGVVAVGLVVVAGLSFVTVRRGHRRQAEFDDEFTWGHPEDDRFERIEGIEDLMALSAGGRADDDRADDDRADDAPGAVDRRRGDTASGPDGPSDVEDAGSGDATSDPAGPAPAADLVPPEEEPVEEPPVDEQPDEPTEDDGASDDTAGSVDGKEEAQGVEDAGDVEDPEARGFEPISDKRHSPDDVLAVLLAEVNEASERLGRLSED